MRVGFGLGHRGRGMDGRLIQAGARTRRGQVTQGCADHSKA